MNGLSFADATWLWGNLILLPLLALRLYTHLRSARLRPGLVSPRLASRLVNGAGAGPRWAVFVLQALATALLFAALARPQWGYEEIEAEYDARNLLIAIDTSRSMMADDLAPNRLTRAKLAAKDIVLSLPDDRIGLIAFAGKPFLQAPLTVDHEAILEAIDQLDTETIPRGGTNLSAAVALALETVEEAELGPSALVLFSDGEALEGMEEIEKIRKQALTAQLSILTVGVGTAEGAIIPETDDNGNILPGVFVKDEQGQVVRTRLITEALRSLAAEGGSFIHLGGQSSLTQTVERIRQRLASSRESGETSQRPIERFLWPLSGAFALLVLSHLVPLLWLKPRRAQTRPLAFSGPVQRLLALAVGLTSLSLVEAAPSNPDAEIRKIKEELAATDRRAAELRRELDQLQKNRSRQSIADPEERLAHYEQKLAKTRLPWARSQLQMGIGAAAYDLAQERPDFYERAIEAFSEALVDGNDRTRTEAFYNLGNTLYRRGESALKPPGQADPNRVPASPNLEQVIQDWEAALEHYESALQIDAGNLLAQDNRDLVQKRLEQLKEQQEQEQQQQQQQQPQEKDEQQPKEDSEDSKEQDQNQDPDQKQDGSQDQQQEPSDGDPSPKQEERQDSKEESSEESESSDSSEDSPTDDSKAPSPSQPDPQAAPPPEADTPPDGELEANPNQEQPTPPMNGSPLEAQPHPETGYSAHEARQLLEALADETEVRPMILPPARNEKFKNW